MIQQQFAPVRYDLVPLKGGLDLITPTLSLKPGVARDALNYECAVTGGYTRIVGYERYDGRLAPSAAVYSILNVAYSGTLSLGATVNGQTSGATGVAIATTADTLVLTAVTGSFSPGENLRVGATVFGVLSALAGTSGNAQTNAIYIALAANYYRGWIGAVPGAGPVRGVAYFNGTVYAWRNNSANTAMAIYKSSAAGWVAVTLYNEISFTAGGASIPAEGTTLTQGGVTATVKRVVLASGSWAANTAAGRLIITNPSGGAFTAGAATIGAINLTLSGASTPITLAPNGRVELVNSNFGSAVASPRMYGADGVNRGFEFDGDVYVPISTGMTDDTPDHVAVFKNHLFYAFGASVQFSGLGFPYQWTLVLGAGEIAAGENVSNFIVLAGTEQGGALLVQTRNNELILYGSSSLDFQLVNYNNGVGAIAYTAQNMASVYSLDDRGIMALNATLAYGNFDQASLTPNLRPLLEVQRPFASASVVNREKSQYRVFFSTGYGIYATIVNGKFLGALPVLFPNPVNVTWEGEDGTGNELTFFGSDNGYVYMLDAGTSFDGAAINAYITLNYNVMQGPRILKRYRKASVEVQGAGYAAITVSYSLGYGSDQYAPQAVASYASSFSSVSWDSGINWDSGIVWDGRTLQPSEIELQGTAENIAMTFSSNADYMASYTLNSLLIHYSPRRGVR